MAEKENCFYDYANKCDCSEDDRCGCTYPNNMGHDYNCEEQPDKKDKTAVSDGK